VKIDLDLDREEALALLDALGMVLSDRRRQHLPDASPDSYFLLELRAKMERALQANST
jgi:hypothetical protein